MALQYRPSDGALVREGDDLAAECCCIGCNDCDPVLRPTYTVTVSGEGIYDGVYTASWRSDLGECWWQYTAGGVDCYVYDAGGWGYFIGTAPSPFGGSDFFQSPVPHTGCNITGAYTPISTPGTSIVVS